MAKHWRIDAFELWCWRRLLRVPWTARRSNQSILKEISPRCSLEGLMLKLKLQYSGHLMQRVDSLEKTLMLGGIAGRRRKGRQRMRWLDGITDGREFEWTPGDGDAQGGLACCSSWGRKELDTTERLNWTELILSSGASLVTEWYRTCLPMQEMQVWSLGQEYPMEKKMATHSSILAWEIPWTYDLVGYSPWEHKSPTWLNN